MYAHTHIYRSFSPWKIIALMYNSQSRCLYESRLFSCAAMIVMWELLYYGSHSAFEHVNVSIFHREFIILHAFFRKRSTLNLFHMI